MEKMYREIMGIKEGQLKLEKGQEELRNDVSSLKDGQQKLEKGLLKLELDLKPKIDAALDGYLLAFEKLRIIENKVDKLTETVESHDIKLAVNKKRK